jgi:23S rRNA (guanosine2251-2'-O)-methyltransferase
MERLTGVHSVREALRAGRRSLARLRLAPELAARPAGAEIRALAEKRGLPVEELEAGGGAPHQGVELEAGPLPEQGLEELLAEAPEAPWLVALDGVEDPQNLGAIARVADGAGCFALLLTRRHAPPLSPAVSRASAGAIEHLPVGRIPNLRRALTTLRNEGFWSIGADLSDATPLYGCPDRLFEGPLVFVLGAEGRGLRQGIRDAVDHRVEIPMQGQVASLNVATAAAVLLYEAARRRHDPDGPRRPDAGSREES